MGRGMSPTVQLVFDRFDLASVLLMRTQKPDRLACTPQNTGDEDRLA